MKKKTHYIQNAFGVIEIILVLATLAAIVGLVWYAFNGGKKSKTQNISGSALREEMKNIV